MNLEVRNRHQQCFWTRARDAALGMLRRGREALNACSGTPGAEAVIQRELDAHLGPRPTYPRDAYGFSATIASSSRAPDAMAIVPRLMETLLAVAHPYSVDLFVHCANVMLRLGRLLVLVPREMPFSLFAIEIMQAVKQAGAVSLPPVVAYYLKSRTLEQLTDSFVGRILKMLRMEHTPYRRWREVDSMSWT